MGILLNIQLRLMTKIKEPTQGRAKVLYNISKKLSGEKDILDIGKNDKLRPGASINYDDQNDVVNLVANHLSKIFLATYRKKISKTIDNLKGTCN